MSSRYLVNQDCIPPLCDLLTLTDVRTVQVALNGLENILKAGQQTEQRDNPYAVLIEDCFGESFVQLGESFVQLGESFVQLGKSFV